MPTVIMPDGTRRGVSEKRYREYKKSGKVDSQGNYIGSSSSNADSPAPKSSKPKNKSKPSDGSNNSDNIKKTPKGYAYIDKYGFSHVVKDYDTAKKYAKPGTDIYEYHGDYGGGYAKDRFGERMPLPLPGSVPYGNDLRDNEGYQSVMSRSQFDELYPGALGSAVSDKRISTLTSQPNTTLNLTRNTMKNSEVAPTLIPQPITTFNLIPIRSTMEGLGYKVDYDNGTITLTDPATGRTGTIAPGAYTMRDGSAYINPDYVRSWLPTQSVATEATSQAVAPLVPSPVETIDMPLYPLPKPPEYKPYVMKPFEYTPPDYSITSDPSKTTFLPTTKAKDRWREQEEKRYKAYREKYDADYKAWQDMVNAYWEQYKEQQRQTENRATLEQQQKEAERAMQQQRLENALALAETIGFVTEDASKIIQETTGIYIPPGTKTSDERYRQASLAAKAASGGGGGLTPWQQYQIQKDMGEKEAVNVALSLTPYLTRYKSWTDLQADLPRIAPYIGTEAYNELLKLVKNVRNVYFKKSSDPDNNGEVPIIPRDFVPGSPSPLFTGLSELGIYTRPDLVPASEKITDEEIMKYLK